MSGINLGRVILGGIVAGLVINICEFVLNGIVLVPQWIDVMTSIHRPPVDMHQIIHFNLLGLVTGLVAVWTYAAIRPRFGAGPRTAVYAALLTWVTAYFLVDVFPTALGVFPLSLTLVLLVVGLVEIILATLAGAWVYKEP